MKKIFSILIALFLLAGCTNTVSSHGESRPEGSVAISSSTAESSSAAAGPFAVNHDLIALVGITNKELKELYTGECYVFTTSYMVYMDYASPYIFDNPQEPYISFGVSIRSNKVDFELGKIYPSNPFSDDVTITSVNLGERYEDMYAGNYAQKNLKQLFVTEDILTYDLISEKLGQYPELLSEEDFMAKYIVDEKEIYVNFLLVETEYIARDIVIGEYPVIEG